MVTRTKATTAKATATKKAAPAKKVEATKTAAAPKVNPHLAAGIKVSRYSGPSSFVNSNRKAKIMLGRKIEASKVTTRAQQGLYALRESYSEKSFAAGGFDNGILRDLLGAGLVKVSGGQKSLIDGKEYLQDGATPVKVQLTAAGMAYGKA